MGPVRLFSYFLRALERREDLKDCCTIEFAVITPLQHPVHVCWWHLTLTGQHSNNVSHRIFQLALLLLIHPEQLLRRCNALHAVLPTRHSLIWKENLGLHVDELRLCYFALNTCGCVLSFLFSSRGAAKRRNNIVAHHTWPEFELGVTFYWNDSQFDNDSKYRS